MVSIKTLTGLLKRSVEKSLAPKTAIALGGLDSSVIAKLAMGKQCQIQLITFGVEGSEDVRYAKFFSANTRLPLKIEILTESDILKLAITAKKIWPPRNLVDLELAMAVYQCSKMARDGGYDVILNGQGAEELFVGYERHYTYMDMGGDLAVLLKEEMDDIYEREIARNERVGLEFRVQVRYPYLDKKLVSAVFSMPLEERISPERDKKPLLRKIAREIGIPEEICVRKKRAVQYGSGIHKVVMKNQEKIGIRIKSNNL